MKAKDLRHGKRYLYTGGAINTVVIFTEYVNKGYRFGYPCTREYCDLSGREVMEFIRETEFQYSHTEIFSAKGRRFPQKVLQNQSTTTKDEYRDENSIESLRDLFRSLHQLHRIDNTKYFYRIQLSSTERKVLKLAQYIVEKELLRVEEKTDGRSKSTELF